MTGQACSYCCPVIVIVLIAVFSSGASRGASPGARRAERGTGKRTDTSFIINAFHEVTKQLKEKEKELERLKALAEQRAENVESYNENILQCVTSGVMTFDQDAG